MARPMNPKSVNATTKRAYEALGIPSEKFGLIAEVFSSVREQEIKIGKFLRSSGNELLCGPKLTDRLARNIVLIKECFGLPPKQILNLILSSNVSEALKRLESELGIQEALLPLQAAAVEQRKEIIDLLSDDGTEAVHRVELKEVLEPTSQKRLEHERRRHGQAANLNARKLATLQSMRKDTGSDDGPARWRRIGGFIELGLLDEAMQEIENLSAEGLSDEILAPWMRARIALAHARAAEKSAFSNRLIVGEQEPLSAAEAHFSSLADHDDSDAAKCREEAAECCLEAWRVIAPLSTDEFRSALADFPDRGRIRAAIVLNIVYGHGQQVLFWQKPVDETGVRRPEIPAPPAADQKLILKAAQVVADYDHDVFMITVGSRDRLTQLACVAHLFRRLDPKAAPAAADCLRRRVIDVAAVSTSSYPWRNNLICALVPEDAALLSEISATRRAVLEREEHGFRARLAFRELMQVLETEGPEEAWNRLLDLQEAGQFPAESSARVLAGVSAGAVRYGLALILHERAWRSIQASMEWEDFRTVPSGLERLQFRLAAAGSGPLRDDVIAALSEDALSEAFYSAFPSDDGGGLDGGGFDGLEIYDHLAEFDRREFCRELRLLSSYWFDRDPSRTYPQRD